MFTNLDTGGYGYDPVRINTRKKFLLVIFRVSVIIDDSLILSVLF